ncbi:hypothetical protein DFH11DRAFT_1827572 [Phellopilus nigrolimitatus]|nr:hypothetical protein DFH11DRAFT_1827572 [Phellopilus nigrolimitatus]
MSVHNLLTTPGRFLYIRVHNVGTLQKAKLSDNRPPARPRQNSENVPPADLPLGAVHVLVHALTRRPRARRLVAVVGFFPRHILVGCIGSVGVFLIETGLTVCARIDDDDFTYTHDTLKFFLNAGFLVRWLPALALAVLLRAITHRFHHQLIFPAYFLAIPVPFYAVLSAARLDVFALRRAGWLFDMGGADERGTRSTRITEDELSRAMVTMPTQLALLFFNILHPPLNVPALAAPPSVRPPPLASPFAGIVPILASGGLDAPLARARARSLNPLATSAVATFEGSRMRTTAASCTRPALVPAVSVTRSARLVVCAHDTGVSVWHITGRARVPSALEADLRVAEAVDVDGGDGAAGPERKRHQKT